MKGATGKAGKYVKNLIDPKALKDVRACATAIRLKHYELTRPWDDGGRRLLPSSLLVDYQNAINKLVQEFNSAVNDFQGKYPGYVEQAKTDLGQMFDGTQYPIAAYIHQCFGAEYNFEPLPMGEALPMTLREKEELKEQIGKDTREALKASAEALFHRTARSIRELNERLVNYDTKLEAGEATKFHGTMLTEVQRLADLLPSLNIEGDPFLAGIAERLKDELSGLTAEDLKTDVALRRRIIDSADGLAREVEDHAN